MTVERAVKEFFRRIVLPISRQACVKCNGDAYDRYICRSKMAVVKEKDRRGEGGEGCRRLDISFIAGFCWRLHYHLMTGRQRRSMYDYSVATTS